MRKPVFGVSDQFRQKSGCTTSEDGYMLEISDLESRGIVGEFGGIWSIGEYGPLLRKPVLVSVF